MMTDKRFNLITALHAVCTAYYSGQWSRGYRLLCRIERHYKPRNLPTLEEIETNEEWFDTWLIAEKLIANYANKL